MKQLTIELDEIVLVWLTHISEVTGESIESLITNGIYRQITVLEDITHKTFCVGESPQ